MPKQNLITEEVRAKLFDSSESSISERVIPADESDESRDERRKEEQKARTKKK